MRAIAVMMVVLSHLVHIEGKYGRGDHLIGGFFLYGVSGVDLFFVISGFVMIAVSQRRQGHASLSPLRFLYNRITRIYPVYWVYCTMVLAVYLVRPEMVNSSWGNQVLILESYLLWPQRLAPLLAVAWTLTHEMYFYIVFTAMLWGPRRHIPGYLLAWLALVVVGDLVTGAQSDPLQKVVFHPLTLEFIAGCLVAIIIFKGCRGYGRTFFFVGTLLWIANMLGCHLLWAHALPSGWYRVLFFGLPCTLMVYGAVASEFQASLRFPKWLYAVGDASYSIYLSHILILSFIGRIWYRLGQKGLADNIVMIAAMILMVVVYGHLSYRYIEKPLIHRFRRFAATVF